LHHFIDIAREFACHAYPRKYAGVARLAWENDLWAKSIKKGLRVTLILASMREWHT